MHVCTRCVPLLEIVERHSPVVGRAQEVVVVVSQLAEVLYQRPHDLVRDSQLLVEIRRN
jgi:hypothetical protein